MATDWNLPHFFRPKVHQALVSAVIRPTRFVVVAVAHHTTFRSLRARSADTQRPRPVHVSAKITPLKDPAVIYLLSLPSDNWSIKAKRRKTTGTGRCRYLKVVRRKFRNGFREGTSAKPRKTKA
jgi:hypothetical protein